MVCDECAEDGPMLTGGLAAAMEFAIKVGWEINEDTDDLCPKCVDLAKQRRLA